MQIALRTISLILVVLIVLLTLSAFLILQSGQSSTSASSDRIFFSKCEELRQRGCAETPDEWDIIYGDKEFLNACRNIFGDTNIFACVYRFCPACKKFDSAAEEECAARCAGIRIGSLAASQCDSYKDQCSSVPCDVCPR